MVPYYHTRRDHYSAKTTDLEVVQSDAEFRRHRLKVDVDVRDVMKSRDNGRGHVAAAAVTRHDYWLACSKYRSVVNKIKPGFNSCFQWTSICDRSLYKSSAGEGTQGDVENFGASCLYCDADGSVLAG